MAPNFKPRPPKINVVDDDPNFTKCPECGVPIKIGVPICPKCQAEFSWEEDAEITGFSSFCPKCAVRIDAFIPECPNCHARFEWDSPEHEKARKQLEEMKGHQQDVSNEEEVEKTAPLKFKCPNCDFIIEGKPSHCPNCGVPFAWKD